jgi:hypothetical protein
MRLLQFSDSRAVVRLRAVASEIAAMSAPAVSVQPPSPRAVLFLRSASPRFADGYGFAKQNGKPLFDASKI